MNRLARAIAACAGPAIFAAGSLFVVPAAAAPTPFPGLTAFGTPGVMVLPGAYDTRLPTAASQALSPRLALDSGYNLDLGARFDGDDADVNPLISAPAPAEATPPAIAAPTPDGKNGMIYYSFFSTSGSATLSAWMHSHTISVIAWI